MTLKIQFCSDFEIETTGRYGQILQRDRVDVRWQQRQRRRQKERREERREEEREERGRQKEGRKQEKRRQIIKNSVKLFIIIIIYFDRRTLPANALRQYVV